MFGHIISGIYFQSGNPNSKDKFLVETEEKTADQIEQYSEWTVSAFITDPVISVHVGKVGRQL
ncbi:hypothetical protein N7478_007060 [Penicillium angulare]|uniref:uncharacterized protein n=1 Tax=Penicillium angulare TaxID=116970 RepID=UPI002540BB64|nr:uncharacterized protein N7478_007060 [Penicillium angulare]KAJ5281688.1 hypothetical protein N7478_007060 [Penicillium angulare]